MESLESGCPQLCHAVCCALYFPICTRLLQAVWICVALFTNSSKRANLTNSTRTKRKRTPQRCALTALKHIKPYSTLYNHIKPKERRNMLENCRNLWDQDRSRTLTSFLDFALSPHVSTWSKGTRTEWSEWSECATWFAQKLGAWKRPCTEHARGPRGQREGWTPRPRCGQSFAVQKCRNA